MRRVVIDENLPRAFGPIFAEHGFEVLDVRDHGLRGANDDAVFSFSKAHNAAIVTSDVEFANRIHLFEERHAGVILIRLPTTLSVSMRCGEIDRALKQLGAQSLEDHIAVVGTGILRIHGKHP